MDSDENEINDFFGSDTEQKTPVIETTAEKTISEWGNDFDTKKASEEQVIVQTKQPVKQEVKTESIVKKITQIEAEASATVTIGVVDLMQRTILNIILNKKFEKKFTEDQIEIVDRVEDLPDDKLTPEEVSLKKRFNKSFAKYEKTGETIPFNAVEKDEMKEILAEYYKVTGKAVSPNLLLAGAFIDKIGKRVATIMFD
ncbi:MAG: hypothetical protein A3F72_15325 [Bacteroidetes bacterium RIFCSPLOWO2_12_FULL_35_15]|nr:MAG: hypothetical protein A3F72_15325 [Bacteroidetes bacterium RIFCSPLOWO2_12_FULL_35_15]